MGSALTEQEIIGWREVEAFSGMKEHLIRRAIGHYGFPPPRKKSVKHKNNPRISTTNVWLKGEVLIWINLNKGNIPGR